MTTMNRTSPLRSRPRRRSLVSTLESAKNGNARDVRHLVTTWLLPNIPHLRAEGAAYLTRHFQVDHYKAGTVLTEMGKAPGALYILASGEVDIYKPGSNGPDIEYIQAHRRRLSRTSVTDSVDADNSGKHDLLTPSASIVDQGSTSSLGGVSVTSHGRGDAEGSPSLQLPLTPPPLPYIAPATTTTTTTTATQDIPSIPKQDSMPERDPKDEDDDDTPQDQGGTSTGPINIAINTVVLDDKMTALATSVDLTHASPNSSIFENVLYHPLWEEDVIHSRVQAGEMVLHRQESAELALGSVRGENGIQVPLAQETAIARTDIRCLVLPVSVYRRWLADMRRMEKVEDGNFLKTLKSFGSYSDSHAMVTKFTDLFRRHHHQRGDVLVQAGSDIDTVMLIREGEALVTYTATQPSKTTVSLASVGAGTFVGAAAALSNGPPLFTVTATSNMVTLDCPRKNLSQLGIGVILMLRLELSRRASLWCQKVQRHLAPLGTREVPWTIGNESLIGLEDALVAGHREALAQFEDNPEVDELSNDIRDPDLWYEALTVKPVPSFTLRKLKHLQVDVRVDKDSFKSTTTTPTASIANAVSTSTTAVPQPLAALALHTTSTTPSSKPRAPFRGGFKPPTAQTDSPLSHATPARGTPSPSKVRSVGRRLRLDAAVSSTPSPSPLAPGHGHGHGTPDERRRRAGGTRNSPAADDDVDDDGTDGAVDIASGDEDLGFDPRTGMPYVSMMSSPRDGSSESQGSARDSEGAGEEGDGSGPVNWYLMRDRVKTPPAQAIPGMGIGRDVARGARTVSPVKTRIGAGTTTTTTTTTSTASNLPKALLFPEQHQRAPSAVQRKVAQATAMAIGQRLNLDRRTRVNAGFGLRIPAPLHVKEHGDDQAEEEEDGILQYLLDDSSKLPALPRRPPAPAQDVIFASTGTALPLPSSLSPRIHIPGVGRYSMVDDDASADTSADNTMGSMGSDNMSVGVRAGVRAGARTVVRTGSDDLDNSLLLSPLVASSQSPVQGGVGGGKDIILSNPYIPTDIPPPSPPPPHTFAMVDGHDNDDNNDDVGDAALLPGRAHTSLGFHPRSRQEHPPTSVTPPPVYRDELTRQQAVQRERIRQQPRGQGQDARESPDPRRAHGRLFRGSPARAHSVYLQRLGYFDQPEPQQQQQQQQQQLSHHGNDDRRNGDGYDDGNGTMNQAQQQQHQDDDGRQQPGHGNQSTPVKQVRHRVIAAVPSPGYSHHPGLQRRVQSAPGIKGACARPSPRTPLDQVLERFNFHMSRGDARAAFRSYVDLRQRGGHLPDPTMYLSLANRLLQRKQFTAAKRVARGAPLPMRDPVYHAVIRAMALNNDRAGAAIVLSELKKKQAAAPAASA